MYYLPRRKKRLFTPPPPPMSRSPISIREIERLSGKVQGKNASDIEERAAISHVKEQVAFTFRARIGIFPYPKERPKPIEEYRNPYLWYRDWEKAQETPDVRPILPIEMSMNFPGELEIDLLANRFDTLIPILIDGEISHYMTQGQEDLDRQKTDAINISLAPYGARPVIRVPFWALETQEMSDEYFNNLYRTV